MYGFSYGMKFSSKRIQWVSYYKQISVYYELTKKRDLVPRDEWRWGRRVIYTLLTDQSEKIIECSQKHLCWIKHVLCSFLSNLQHKKIVLCFPPFLPRGILILHVCIFNNPQISCITGSLPLFQEPMQNSEAPEATSFSFSLDRGQMKQRKQ